MIGLLAFAFAAFLSSAAAQNGPPAWTVYFNTGAMITKDYFNRLNTFEQTLQNPRWNPSWGIIASQMGYSSVYDTTSGQPYGDRVNGS